MIVQAICLVFDRLSRNTYQLNWEDKYVKFDACLMERACKGVQHTCSKTPIVQKMFEILQKLYVFFTDEMKQVTAYKGTI